MIKKKDTNETIIWGSLLIGVGGYFFAKKLFRHRDSGPHMAILANRTYYLGCSDYR